MRIAIYGLPCAGKSSLLHQFPGAKCGRDELERIALCNFNQGFAALSEPQKHTCRQAWALEMRQFDNLLTDGHYAFGSQVVFTPEDGACYDTFIYLYVEPTILKSRMAASAKNQKYLDFDLAAWQDFEIASLREFCLENYKDFYVIDDPSLSHDVKRFVDLVAEGKFSCLHQARQFVAQVQKTFEPESELYVLDGDKTVSCEDSARFFLSYQTKIFDNNFYSGYQSWKHWQALSNLENELLHRSANSEQNLDKQLDLTALSLNESLLQQVDLSRAIMLTGGSSFVWSKLCQDLGIAHCFYGEAMSAECKFFTAHLLQDAGFQVHCYGDSMSDYYMLRYHQGTLVINQNISRSLKKVALDGLNYFFTPYVLAHEQDPEILQWIERTKSTSGVHGNKLAQAHFVLGQHLGRKIAAHYQPQDCEIVIMLRGGLFLGTGLYDEFNAGLYLFDHNHQEVERLGLTAQTIIVVDSVINTGKQMQELVCKLKDLGHTVVVVTGVIQQDSLSLFSSQPMYAVRTSANKYVGARQNFQVGHQGPDTSDRLFNLIRG